MTNYNCHSAVTALALLIVLFVFMFFLRFINDTNIPQKISMEVDRGHIATSLPSTFLNKVEVPDVR